MSMIQVHPERVATSADTFTDEDGGSLVHELDDHGNHRLLLRGPQGAQEGDWTAYGALAVCGEYRAATEAHGTALPTVFRVVALAPANARTGA
jgi:hypothetical protein